MMAGTCVAALNLNDAASLIEARGWDRMADPYAADATGGLSVRGALGLAAETSRRRVSVTSEDGEGALAAYVIDTVLIPMHATWVTDCLACTQCRDHRERPLTLIRASGCANGCELCEEHEHLVDPHGYDQPPTDDIIDMWERLMPHQRDVITGLRAAALRLAL
ncbi:hypothetical protein ABIA31_002887 [Catenulispora sp. MAP5-51]|uniref:hypothetical protein n=1 Tax=Catenulispora sp. MAP5-51 TaxID=3156298 RepID=UPI0035148DF1